jgi:magnesium transporter
MQQQMARKKKKRLRHKKPGSPPGTLVFTGEAPGEKPIVHLTQYNSQHFTSEVVGEGHKPSVAEDLITWYDVRGLHDVTLIESFGKAFDLHPLALEDVLNIQQRPKFEEYQNGIFIIAQLLRYDENIHHLYTEQIAIFFGKNFLLSFQENLDDSFGPIRERLQAGRGRIRSSGPDYLAYALLDNVLDHYFLALDKLEISMEQLEDDITLNPSDDQKVRLHDLKFQLLYLRKSVVPLREAINAFARSGSSCVNAETELFLRDLYDHAIRIADLVDTYRDIATGLQELYLSELSLRMNKVMQFLTIITTVFVPITFLAGVYGMNFKYMPELELRYAYFVVWGVMIAMATGFLIYFKRKNWL